MYAKLVLRNARRSIQDYLVYILTMTICVTLSEYRQSLMLPESIIL